MKFRPRAYEIKFARSASLDDGEQAKTDEPKDSRWQAAFQLVEPSPDGHRQQRAPRETARSGVARPRQVLDRDDAQSWKHAFERRAPAAEQHRRDRLVRVEGIFFRGVALVNFSRQWVDRHVD